MVSAHSRLAGIERTGLMHKYSSRTVTPDEWHQASLDAAQGRAVLLSLWGEKAGVFMALLDAGTPFIRVLNLPCPQGAFPSVARHHPPAGRLERAIHDLFGLKPADAPDTRPWLNHGKWGLCHPMGGRMDTSDAPPAYSFLAAEGENLHEIPVGPVHAGIIEPGHFRFTANGETIVRLEERLGYTHKGVESLMEGADLAHAARLSGRISGDSTVAYGVAFSRAVEKASDMIAPPRAQALRGLMAELERIANHFGDIGAICNDASFSMIHAHCWVLREKVLRAAEACFGHRLMRDCVVPGGVAANIEPKGVSAVHMLLDDIDQRFPALINLYDFTPSLRDRTVSTGIVKHELVQQFGAGGYIGRASGRSFDARKTFGYHPYDNLSFDVPVLHAGDVDARVWIRIREVGQSLSLIRQILAGLPGGPVQSSIKQTGKKCEGYALVEGFRGDIFVWLRLDGMGRIARCHLRDPSWFQWPLLEAAVEGNIVADFPLCNKSFNCSYSGHDL